MSVEYEEYERQCKEIKETNQTYLNDFREALQKKGLTAKTINNHVSNVDFYINDFLCYEEPQDVRCGCHCISQFLGSWFIRKASWSSCAQIKSNAASIKKFYKLMLDKGIVDEDDYNTLCEDIVDEMDDWLGRMKRYDSLTEENLDDENFDFYEYFYGE